MAANTALPLWACVEGSNLCATCRTRPRPLVGHDDVWRYRASSSWSRTMLMPLGSVFLGWGSSSGRSGSAQQPGQDRPGYDSV
jgi:hypothetical protein